MSWNYRVLRFPFKNPITKKWETYDAVHEVYYDKDGTPGSWTNAPVKLLGETKEDIVADLFLVEKAFNKPVVVISKKGKFLKEV